jgi:hypothetical protein
MWNINSCRGVKLADQPFGHVIYMMTSSILLYYLYCTPSSKGYNFYIIGSAIIVDSRGRDFMLYFHFIRWAIPSQENSYLHGRWPYFSRSRGGRRYRNNLDLASEAFTTVFALFGLLEKIIKYFISID